MFCGIGDLTAKLKKVNEKLWTIEDDIRNFERRRDFSDEFIQLARAVYLNNDDRARLKRSINELLGSNLIEEKSTQPIEPIGASIDETIPTSGPVSSPSSSVRNSARPT